MAKDVKRRKVESSKDKSEKPTQCEVADRLHASPKSGLFDSFQSKMNTLTSDAATQKIVPSSSSGESTIVSGQDLNTTKNTDKLPSTDTDRVAPEASAARLQEASGETRTSVAAVTCSSHTPISTPVATSGKGDLQSETGTEEPSRVGMESSRRPCEDTRSMPDMLNKDLFSTEAMEPEEIQRSEKIKRLKELLKEKEAALEAMRKKMTM